MMQNSISKTERDSEVDDTAHAGLPALLERSPDTEGDLLLLHATEGEGAILLREMRAVIKEVRNGRKIASGRLQGRDCRLVLTGIGMVNAAIATATQIERRRPSLVVQVGIAGAYVPGGLRVGEVAWALEEIYGEVGVVTPDGFVDAETLRFEMIPGRPPRYHRIPVDEDRARQAAARSGAAVGPFLTLSQGTGVRVLGDALARRFGALCESMEGAAAAHACALYQTPFLEVRGISNLVEDRCRERWDIPAAAEAAQRAMLDCLSCLE